MNKHRPKNRLSFVSNPKDQNNTSTNLGYHAPIFSPSDPLPSGNPLHLFFLLLFAAFFFILATADFDEYVLLKDDGTYQLTDERKGKLIREIKKSTLSLSASKNNYSATFFFQSTHF